MMTHLESLDYNNYLLGSPRTDLLLPLIQFSFTRALLDNMALLNLSPGQMDGDALSPFSTPIPHQQQLVPEPSTLPATLRPTAVQLTMPHHPWLDLLPSPQMRDNLIRAQDGYDAEVLCEGMKGTGSAYAGRTGIIVWTRSWDPEGWEVTEPFVREWGWTLKGCEDLMRATDRWRAERGEQALFGVEGWWR